MVLATSRNSVGELFAHLLHVEPFLPDGITQDGDYGLVKLLLGCSPILLSNPDDARELLGDFFFG